MVFDLVTFVAAFRKPNIGFGTVDESMVFGGAVVVAVKAELLARPIGTFGMVGTAVVGFKMLLNSFACAFNGFFFDASSVGFSGSVRLM